MIQDFEYNIYTHVYIHYTTYINIHIYKLLSVSNDYLSDETFVNNLDIYIYIHAYSIHINLLFIYIYNICIQ